MKKLLVLIIFIISYAGVYDLYSQVLKQAELNPEYLNYIELKNKGQIKNYTDEGNYLGYVPHPFKMKTDKPYKADKSKDKIQAPPEFDLRDVSGVSYVSSVKNQGNCGSCWAFATMGSIESFGLVSGRSEEDFSEQNLKNCHGFYWDHCYGGNQVLSTSYLSRQSGPYYETDDPYDISDDICQTGLTLRTRVMEAWYLPGRNSTGYEEILKNHIMNYGALYTTMRWESAYYNSTTYCYNYTGTSISINHAVTLVGWDDNKDMSCVGASSSGAWIIKNSWGPGWGENGYFYISYEDLRVNVNPTCWPERISCNANEELYYYDEIGCVSSAYYPGYNSAYGLVKFVADNDLQITKIATWIVSSSTNITVAIYDDFNGSTLSNLLGTISQQSCDYAGYYTFDLDTPISMSSGDDFYIRVYYSVPGNGSPLPIEAVMNNYCYPTIETGKCWTRRDGSSWVGIGPGTPCPWDLCIRAFTIITAPTLVSPDNNATGVSIVPSFDWSDVGDADSYTLQIASDADFNNLVINQSGITASAYDLSVGYLDYNTQYYWRVNATAGDKTSDWSDSWQFTTENVPAPVLVSPSNRSSEQSLTLTLDWQDVSSCDGYQLQVSSSRQFRNFAVNETSLSSSQYEVPSGTLEEDTKYYWKVKAYYGTNYSSWSGLWDFTTVSSGGGGTELGTPELLSPSNQARNISLTPTMDWSDVTDADTYTLQLSLSKKFSSITYEQSGIPATSSEYTIPANTLDYSTAYYWHVRAESSSETGSWSNAYKFTTQSAKLSDDYTLNLNDLIIKLNIYPNPVDDNLYINVELQHKSEIHIRLINMLGNEIVSFQNREAEHFNKQIYMQPLATGIYILEIKIGNELIHRKIVKE